MSERAERSPPTDTGRCGEYAGYGLHWKAGEYACEPCLAARREYVRLRTAGELPPRRKKRSEPQQPPPEEPASGIEGKRIVVTGKLPLRRSEIAELIEAAGGIFVKTAVSTRTDYLVVGEPDSYVEEDGLTYKHRRALELGTAILTPQEFYELAGIDIDAAVANERTARRRASRPVEEPLEERVRNLEWQVAMLCRAVEQLLTLNGAADARWGADPELDEQRAVVIAAAEEYLAANPPPSEFTADGQELLRLRAGFTARRFAAEAAETFTELLQAVGVQPGANGAGASFT